MAIIAVVCVVLVAIVVVTTVERTRPEVYKATITVSTSGRVLGQVNSDYVGLSFEAGTLISGKFDNVGDLAPMLRNLGGGVMRFGGNSVDQTSYSGVPTPTLDGLARLADAAGWTVLYSENLGAFGAGSAGAVTADSANVSAALGSHLAAIACGNEPDDFSHNGIRLYSYGESDYLTESANCLAAVHAGAPGVALAGPDTARTGWLGEFVAKEPAQLEWLDQHYYALGCKTGGLSPGQLAAKLLSPEQVASEVAMFKVSAAAADAAHAQLRISETNSACGGGFVGLSGTYASALWAIDYMLTGAEHGVGGMNFHGGLGSSCLRYTPLCQVGANEYAAQPIYYGLLFTHLLGVGSLLPVAESTSTKLGNVAAFALRPPSGGLRLIVENLTPYQADAALRVGGDPGSATALQLTAPSVLATSGVSIQGAVVAPNGSFTPGTPDSLSCSAGSCPVTIAPYSAVLVTVLPPAAGRQQATAQPQRLGDQAPQGRRISPLQSRQQDQPGQEGLLAPRRHLVQAVAHPAPGVLGGAALLTVFGAGGRVAWHTTARRAGRRRPR
jgi:hypothetical protein